MTNKLPWATAAVIIVVAAIGAWTIFGAAPAAPPTAGTASITATLGTGTVFGAPPDDSGIEAIYIMATGQDYTENMADYPDNHLENIFNSAETVDIAYDTRFDICVAVTGHTDNMGLLNADYMRVTLGAYTDLGEWNIPYENSDDNATIDESIFKASDGTTIRFNVVWDNNGNGYELKADDNLEMENVGLWLRGPVTG